MAPTQELAIQGEWLRDEHGKIKPFVQEGGIYRPVTWMPMPGSQSVYMNCPITEVLYEGNRGGGKGLPLDELVLTPHGWRPIGALRVADEVCVPDGTISQVIGVFPQGKRPVYRIVFDDGSSCRCDDYHIWPIHRPDQHEPEQYHLRVMSQVIDLYQQGEKLGVPVLTETHVREEQVGTAPVTSLSSADLHTLGMWLFCGKQWSDGEVHFSELPEPLVDVMLQRGGAMQEDSSWVLLPGEADRLREVFPHLFRMNPEKAPLPEQCYSLSSSQKLYLLQGICDAAGMRLPRGGVQVLLHNRKKALDLQQFIWSMGGKAYLTKEKVRNADGELVTQQQVQIELPRGRTEFRHRTDLVSGSRKKRLHRWIVEIEELPEEETVCIKVDHPSGLFVTRDYIVTHNTDALLMSFAQHIGKWGKEWSGIIFRRTFPELEDIRSKANKWFPLIFGDAAKYNKQDHMWRWDSGERLRFAHMMTPDDYHKYHGHSYPFIGWEELTTWPTPDCFVQMMSTCRSTVSGMPRMIRATTNPSGCVPFGEVLTATRGWVPIQDVRVGEKVRSVFPNGEETEAEVTEVIARQWSGTMVRMADNAQYLEFTGDHRLPLTDGKDPDFTLVSYDDAPDQFWRADHDFSMPMDKAECEERDFSGMVYCLTVPGPETFFIRQNGCVWLSGNCGHNWVKTRYHLPLLPGRMVGDVISGEPMMMNGKILRDPSGEPIIQPDRVAIRSRLTENFLLLDADPNYMAMIAASAKNPQQLAAWIEGSWDIVSGGMFDDRWNPKIHILPRFIVPPHWVVDRSFDWGTAKPSSTGWWVESPGDDLTFLDGSRMRTVRGDLIRVTEWDTWNGTPDKGQNLTAREIARGIRRQDASNFPQHQVRRGPADSAIFSKTHTSSTVAKEMEAEGVYFRPADKSPGSRVNGWDKMRELLRAAIPPEDGTPRTDPGLFVTDACTHFIRTIPVLSRSERHPDDIEDGLEDHVADETRYRVYSRRGRVGTQTVIGR